MTTHDRARQCAYRAWIERAVMAVAVIGGMFAMHGLPTTGVANAINAGSSLIAVEVAVHRDHIRVAVVDDAAGTPHSQNAAPTDTHGRGLRIVEALARSCGVRATPGGKEVWAELALHAGGWAFDCRLPIAG